MADRAGSVADEPQIQVYLLLDELAQLAGLPAQSPPQAEGRRSSSDSSSGICRALNIASP